MSLFAPDIEFVGVDIAVRQPPDIPGALTPDLRHFDGTVLPFEDDSFDVVQTCYVLHHLAADHAAELLEEMTRVARRRLVILEDSMPKWPMAYRLRNWAHLVESNLLYADESDDFSDHYSSSNFRTIDEWRSLFSELPEVASVEVDRLDGIKRYEHHTLFVVEFE